MKRGLLCEREFPFRSGLPAPELGGVCFGEAARVVPARPPRGSAQPPAGLLRSGRAGLGLSPSSSSLWPHGVLVCVSLMTDGGEHLLTCLLALSFLLQIFCLFPNRVVFSVLRFVSPLGTGHSFVIRLDAADGASLPSSSTGLRGPPAAFPGSCFCRPCLKDDKDFSWFFLCKFYSFRFYV